MAEAGCDAFTIAQLLGHSDVRDNDALREGVLKILHIRMIETRSTHAISSILVLAFRSDKL